jgi:D-xylose transport system substrate-binding protein
VTAVRKDSRDLGREAAKAAVALAGGKKVPGAVVWDGGEKKVKMDSMFLKPTPITAANLDVIIKAGAISKEEACRGVSAATAPAACK